MQDAFDPAGVQFKTFPTMAKHIVETMLPEHDAKIHERSLMNVSGFSLKCAYMTYFAFY